MLQNTILYLQRYLRQKDRKLTLINALHSKIIEKHCLKANFNQQISNLRICNVEVKETKSVIKYKIYTTLPNYKNLTLDVSKELSLSLNKKVEIKVIYYHPFVKYSAKGRMIKKVIKIFQKVDDFLSNLKKN